MVDTLSMEQREELVTKLDEYVVSLSEDISFSPNRNKFDERVLYKNIQDTLNKLFPGTTCTEVIVTMNYDKVPFYIAVDPTYPDGFMYAAIYAGENYTHLDRNVSRYGLELDSKLFEQFDHAQITEIILYTVHQITNHNLIDKVIRGIEASLLNNLNVSPSEKYIRLKAVCETVGIFDYAIKTYINQIISIGNLAYNDPVELNGYLNMHVLDGLNIFATVVNDICGKINGDIIDQSQHPAVQIFDWLLSVYLEPELHANDIIHTLNQAATFTASTYMQTTAKRTVNMVIDDTHEAMVRKSKLQESLISVNEGFSLFKSLKMNGLRSIEDDLYEYKIRIKNCEEEEEGMYILRQINTRMAILDDYMRNTELSQREIDRWTSVMNSYRDLRVELGKKKLGPKKQYGIFIDYDKIDQLD